MENSQPPKSDDTLKPHDDEVGEGTDKLPPLIHINEGLLGIEPHLDAVESSGEEADEDGKKGKRKKKKGAGVGRFLPQPDLVEPDSGEMSEKPDWATKVTELLGFTSSSDEPLHEGALPPTEVVTEVPSPSPDEFEDTRVVPTPPVRESPTPTQTPELSRDLPESSEEVPIRPPEREWPIEVPVEPQAALAEGGDGGGLPPEGPPPSAELPASEPGPENVRTILARQSAEDSRAAHTDHTTETGPTYVTNNYYQRADILPALVVDQLSRRRDRKIRRHGRVQDKMADRTKKQVEALSAQVADSRHKASHEAASKQKPEAEQVLQQVSSSTEIKEPVSVATSERQKATSQNEQMVMPSSRERLEQKVEAPIIEAEKVQKVVEAAAEAAVPIESLYEKRHEIKGSEDFKAAAQAAIQRENSYYNNEIRDIESQNIEQQINVQPTKAAPSSHDKLYSQAAKGGVLAALAFIIAFLVLYFIFLRG